MRRRFLLATCAAVLLAAVGCDSKKSEAPKDPAPPPKGNPSGVGAGTPGGAKQGGNPGAQAPPMTP